MLHRLPAIPVCAAWCAALGFGMAVMPGHRALAAAALFLAAVPLAMTPVVRPVWVPLALVAALVGFARAEATGVDPTLLANARQVAGADVVLVGRVADDPRRQANGYELLLEPIRIAGTAGDLPPVGDVMVGVRGALSAAYGDQVQVAGRIQVPRQIPGFDRRAYLAGRGANLEMRVTQVDVISRGVGLARIPGWIRDTYSRAIDAALGPPHSAVLLGVVLGIRQAIPPRLNQDLISTGLVHLLVLSGLKVAIFARLVQAALGAVLGRAAVVPSILLIGLYALVGGATPAAVRAAVMGALTLVAARLGRTTHVWTSLMVVAAAMLAWRPELAWDVGFQLSFLGTAAIVLLTPPIERRLHWMPGWLREPFAVTCAAQVGTLPLMASDFSVLSPIAPVANALVLPLLPAIVIAGLALGPLSVVPALASALAPALTALLTYVEQIATLLARIPQASVPIAAFPSWAGIAYYSGLAGAVAGLSGPGRQRRAALIAGIAAPLLITCAEMTAWTFPDSSVRIMAVGNGQAILISGPGGRVLVDGGPSPARLRDQLGLALPPWSRDLVAIVITAPGLGHVAGLAGLDRRAQEVIIPAVDLGGTAWRTAALDSVARGASVVRARAGQESAIAGLTFQFIAPEPTDPGDEQGTGYIAFRALWPDGRSLCDLSDLDSQSMAVAAARLPGRCDWMVLPGSGGTAPPAELMSIAAPDELVISAASARPSREMPRAFIRRTDQEGTIVLQM